MTVWSPSAAAARSALSSSSCVSQIAHALAGREAVRLDDARGAGDGEDAGVRDARGGHDLLGERLGSFDLRRLLAGAEDLDAGVAQMVGKARDERRLRTDDDEVDLQLAGEGQQPFGVLRPHRMAVRKSGHSGVSGRAMQRLQLGATGDLPGERVLATARSDDENPHAPDFNVV